MRVPNIGRAMAKPKPPDDGVRLRINDEVTPLDMPVRTVDNDAVCDAFYAYGTQPHSHPLQNAQDDVDMAVWGWNEQGRQIQQEDKNKDETINKR
jgi:hypothetical protein